MLKKSMCKDLRGACEAEITGETPEEMGENCKKHVMEMVQAGDKAHLAAIESMKQLSPEEQQKWHEEFKERFEELEVG